MSRSKKILAGFAVVYLVLIVWVSYDIAQKTTFPGSSPQLKERIKEKFLEKDSLKQKKDSINRNLR